MAAMLLKGVRGRSGFAKRILHERLCSSSTVPSAQVAKSSSIPTLSSSSSETQFFSATSVRYVNLSSQLSRTRYSFVVARNIQTGAQAVTDVSSTSVIETRISGNDEIQAAGSALQSYLQKIYKAYLSDAASVVENAPATLQRIVDLTKARSTENIEEASVPSKSKKKRGKTNSVRNFGDQVAEFLSETGFNGLEPVLVSIGVPAERVEALVAKLSTEAVDIQTFLFAIRGLEKLGIPRSSIGTLVETNSGLTSYTTDEIEAGFEALKSIEIPEEEVIALIHKYPPVLKKEVVLNIKFLSEELEAFSSKNVMIRKAISDNPQRFHEYTQGSATDVINCLRSYDLTTDRLNLLLQRHFRLLFMDVPKEIVAKVQFLKDLGISRKIIAKVINRCPNFLFLNLEDNLRRRLDYFKSLGFNESEFALVISRYPVIFSASLDNKIKPVVAELKSLGLTDDGVKKCVLHRPSLFAYKLGGEISNLIKDLKESGYSESKKVTAFIKLYSRGSEHRKKVEACLIQHGLSASEAKMVVDKEPGVLGYNETAIAKKLDNLTKTLGVTVQDVVEVPEYLSFGLKGRILKRQRVLSYLKSKGLLTDSLTLKQLVSPSNKQFYNDFLKSHCKDEELKKLWFRTRDGVGNTESLDFLVSHSGGKAKAKVSI